LSSDYLLELETPKMRYRRVPVTSVSSKTLYSVVQITEYLVSK